MKTEKHFNLLLGLFTDFQLFGIWCALGSEDFEFDEDISLILALKHLRTIIIKAKCILNQITIEWISQAGIITSNIS